MDSVELEKELRAAIINELDFCEYSETPIICGMIQDPASKEKLIAEIEKRVITQRIYIADAIVQIDNEYNPNTLD